MIFRTQKKIFEAKERINTKLREGQEMDTEISMLEKLIIKCGPESQVPLVMAFDMIAAGKAALIATS